MVPTSEDAEQLTGRSVAEECAGAAGEDGGEPVALLGDPGVADRVDAAMDRVKVPFANQALDRIRAQSEVE